jgi:hypothetical protein
VAGNKKDDRRLCAEESGCLVRKLSAIGCQLSKNEIPRDFFFEKQRSGFRLAAQTPRKRLNLFSCEGLSSTIFYRIAVVIARVELKLLGRQ